MLKTSFINDFKKVETYNNRCTVVTLKGLINIPDDVWEIIPESIKSWFWNLPDIDILGDRKGLIITTVGKFVSAEEDTFDALLGERIAESRAKIKIYKFMCAFVQKMMEFYANLLYGKLIDTGTAHTVTSSQYKGGLADVYEKYRAFLIKECKH